MIKKPYSQDQLKAAVKDVNDQVMNIKQAAEHHGVPRSTLSDKIRGITPLHAKKGPSSILTSQEKSYLVEWIIISGNRGFPISKEQLFSSVARLLRELGRENPFTNGILGKKWYASFMHRNPQLSERTPLNLTLSRARVTIPRVRSWFTEVQDYLEVHDLSSILLDPQRVFNADEAAFFFNPKAKKVIVARGSKNVYNLINLDEKECPTVLMTVSAAGAIPPPMVVFKYVRIPQAIAESVPEDWGIGTSDSGWMTSESFFEYIANIFNQWLIENKIPRPVILFVDGHASHLTFHLNQFCMLNGIVLVALTPNATHLLQPLDVAVFRTLKSSWVTEVTNFRMTTQQPLVKRTDFCPLLKKAIESSVTPEVIASGFRKCGLVPWNVEAIDFSKIPSQASESQNAESSNSEAVPAVTESSKPLSATDEWKITLRRLNSLIPPGRLEHFKLVMSLSNWPELVDDEDVSLFTTWRQIFVSAHDGLSLNSENESISEPQPTGEASTSSNFSNNPSTSAHQLTGQSNIYSNANHPSTSAPQLILTYTPGPADVSLLSTPQPTDILPPALSFDSLEVFHDQELELDDLINFQGLIPESSSSAQDESPEPAFQRPSVSNTSSNDKAFVPLSRSTPISTLVEIPAVLKTPTSASLDSEVRASTQGKVAQNSPTTASITVTEPKSLSTVKPSLAKTPLKTQSKTVPQNVPSPFKRSLFYPGSPKKSFSSKRSKERTPAVASSKEWQLFYEKKIEKKKILEEEKKKRQDKREEQRKRKIEEAGMKQRKGKRSKKPSNASTLESSGSESVDGDLEDCNLSCSPLSYCEGDYVVVEYEEELFPGQILKLEADKASVKTMAIAGISVWKWPLKDDVCFYEFCDIKAKIAPPKIFNKRGHFKVPEMAALKQ